MQAIQSAERCEVHVFLIEIHFFWHTQWSHPNHDEIYLTNFFDKRNVMQNSLLTKRNIHRKNIQNEFWAPKAVCTLQYSVFEPSSILGDCIRALRNL